MWKTLAVAGPAFLAGIGLARLLHSRASQPASIGDDTASAADTIDHLLLGDLGGTNLRLQLRTRNKVLATKRLKTANLQAQGGVKGFVAALNSFLSDHHVVGHNAACVLSVCGPVIDGIASTTAVSMGDGWSLDQTAIAAQLGIRDSHLRLINDFVSVGISVGALPAAQLHTIHRGLGRQEHGTIAIFGPGTGMGACLLVWSDQDHAYQTFPSEAGMASFCPRTPEQWALREWLARKFKTDHVDLEWVVSGGGLGHIYEFLREQPEFKDDEHLGSDLDQSIVRSSEAAAIIVQHQDVPMCRHAVELFQEALGAECGDMAMRVRPTGGVVLAGGAVHKMQSLLSAEAVCRSYTNKGHATVCCTDIPLFLCGSSGDELSIAGCATFAHRTWAFPQMTASEDAMIGLPDE